MKNRYSTSWAFIFVLGLFHSPRPAHATDVRTIEGLTNPWALALENETLYVTNSYAYPWDVPEIAVIDVSNPGSEYIVDHLPAPAFGNDLKVINGRLFLIGGYPHSRLYTRSLDEDTWAEIPLSVQDAIGPIPSLFWVEGFLYVLHESNHFMDQVDVDAFQVVGRIDLPVQQFRLAFAPGYMAALAAGLQYPSCDSPGPYLTLYRFPQMEAVYTVDAQGDCPFNVYMDDLRISLVYDAHFRSYDRDRGELLSVIATKQTYFRGAETDSGFAIGTQPGYAVLFNAAGSHLCEELNLLQNEQRASPALGAFLPGSAGRVFVANFNDNTLSIIENYLPCDQPLTTPARW